MGFFHKEFKAKRYADICDEASVILVYAEMALVDCFGVLSSMTGLTGVSSALFFFWFAVMPLPVGAFCKRVGSARVLFLSSAGLAFACLFLVSGAWGRWLSCAGFCVAGLANVCLQVAIPVLVAERFRISKLAGIVTGGLFAKTVVAVAFPFLVSALAGCGCWWLSLVPFLALSIVACVVMRGRIRFEDMSRESKVAAFNGFRRVLKDPIVCCSILAFAIAIVVDVIFNLAVPGIVSRRFGGEGNSIGVVYAVWFGVKLPLMLLGSRLFLWFDARRFFAGAALVALVGVVMMTVCEGWWAYLVGVGLFAAGFANVYGYVFGAAAPRHPAETSAVSALLVTAIAAGALASPLLAIFGAGVILVLVALLLPFAIFLSCFRSKT